MCSAHLQIRQSWWRLYSICLIFVFLSITLIPSVQLCHFFPRALCFVCCLLGSANVLQHCLMHAVIVCPPLVLLMPPFCFSLRCFPAVITGSVWTCGSRATANYLYQRKLMWVARWSSTTRSPKHWSQHHLKLTQLLVWQLQQGRNEPDGIVGVCL